MQKHALVVIDIQNDITKNYKQVIDNVNQAIGWAVDNDIPVVYIRHEFLQDSARKFRPNTPGVELVPDMDIASETIFVKNKGNALSSEGFLDFIAKNGIESFILAGADATQCVKSTCFNMCKAGYDVTVLSDCITSWDMKKIPAMLEYYESKGARIVSSKDL
jgi:nicotinamidase-related amidase